MNKHSGPPVAEAAVNVQTLVSPSGLEFWLVEDYAVPLVSLEFAFQGGSAIDPGGKDGAANLLASLLDEGAGDLDSQAFQRALDEKAIEMSFSCDRDHLSGRMRTLARNLDRAAALLRLAVNAPRFDEGPFARVREQVSARLRHDANDPASVASRVWRTRVFAGHAYASPTDGTLESLIGIERADLTALRARQIVRDGVTIAVVGAIDAARASALVDQAFAELPTRGSPIVVGPAPFAGVGGIETVDLDVPQTTIRFGRPALPREDPDYIASLVNAHVLGGGTGLSSRLFREVREKRGLAYSVSASIVTAERASYLYGGTTTKNERAKESLEVIAGQIRDVGVNGLNEQELEKGKRYLIGAYPLRFDTSTKIAGQLVHIQLDGHGPEWLVERNRQIAAVTMDAAKRAGERVFGDGALSVVAVGRPEGMSV
jgi:zinc protease